MTPDERVAALQRRGYQPRQAAFLVLVTLAGGYFLRRHYAAFLDRRDGAVGTVFLRKVMAPGHVERTRFVRRAQLYHVNCQALYAAIGEPHSRSQRTAALTRVVERLMLLDVLVAHPGWHVLATEREKLDWLGTRGVTVSDARGVVIVRKQGANDTEQARWIGTTPLCLAGDEQAPTFIHVHAPTRAAADFSAFLMRHRRLFARLRAVRLVFCSAWPDVIPDAERRAVRVSRGLSPDERAVEGTVLRRELLTHFEARQRYSRCLFRSFDDASLKRLHSDLGRFAGPSYEALYVRWEKAGDAAISDDDVLHAASAGVRGEFELLFSGHLVPFSYPVYGDDRRTTRRRRTAREERAA